MSILEIKKLGTTKGLKLISTQILKDGSKYLWMCKNRHRCQATEKQIRNGFQCKKCKNFISEEKVRFIFEQLTQEKFVKTRKILNGRLELDGYCDVFRIAFEYNGTQHYYKHSWWHHQNNSLQDQQERDRQKTKLCQSKNISKLDISFKQIQDLDKLTKLIKTFLLDHQVPIYQDVNWNWFDYLPDNYKTLQRCAKKRNGELLTPCFLGSHSKHIFKCNVCDNEWKATSKDILNKNSWCPFCSNNQKYTIKQIQGIAHKKQIKFLSKKYKNTHTKYRWRCMKCSHIWWAKFNAIQQKTGCPKCAGNQPVSASRFNKYIQERNIRLLMEFLGMSYRHSFECLACHNVWDSAAANIWNNRGCPFCSNNKKRITIDNLYKLAMKRNLKLSKKCLGYHIPHEWECIKCGRNYKLKPSNVQRGTSCRTCKIRARKEVD